MRKTILASLLAGFLPALSSTAQQPPAPSYTCPTVQLGPKNTAVNYKALNLSVPAPATKYTDLNSKNNLIVPGTWCYIVQAQRNAHKSLPSNTAMATLKPSNHEVVLTWKAPPNCAGCTYILSRTAAVATPAPAKGSSNRNAPTALVK